MIVGKKLIAAMALISIVPSLIIALVVNVQMQDSIDGLQKSSLESLANVVSAHIYDFCNGQEMDSRFFGQVSAYRYCLEARQNGAAYETVRYWDSEVESLFKQTTIINDNIDGGALMDADGVTILAYNKREEGKSVANTEMYERIMSGEELYRSTVVNEDGTRNLNIVVPVKSLDGSIIGLVKREVNLSNLNLYIDEVKIGETGYVYVMDENATLIYHGSEDKMDLAVGEFQDREELDELMSRVSNGTLEQKTGIIRYDNRGVDTVAAYSQIEELDWVVIVAVENDEIQGPVDKAKKTIVMASILVGLITVFACFIIVQSLLYPLVRLQDSLRQIAGGDYSVRCQCDSGGELSPALERVNDLAIRLEKQEKELVRAKNRDSLTDMYNRTGVLKKIQQHLHEAEEQALLIFDLDEFEVLNDMMGQETGDGVLVELAQNLTALPDCAYCIGRYGGDSFILLMDGEGEELTPTELAAWIRGAVEQIRYVADKPVHITASVGIALIDDGGADLNTYIKRAQIALHKAKNSGKNTDAVFTDEF